MSLHTAPLPRRVQCPYCDGERGFEIITHVSPEDGYPDGHTEPCDHCEGSGTIASELTFKWDGTSYTVTMSTGQLFFIDQDFVGEHFYITGEDGKLVSDGFGSPESAMAYLEDQERENGGWA